MGYRIPTGNLVFTDAEKKRINEVMESGIVSENKNCREFEEKWADFIGTKHCTVLNSGSSALIVGLRALNYKLKKKNLKIATTPFTYIATINSILLTGNTPVFVDVDDKNYGMCPKALEKTFEEHPDIDVVMPVHIMGIPCHINEIKKICDDKKVTLVEDNCQAYGTNHKGKMLGSFGVWSACSFFIAHTLQCSELGSLNTNDLILNRFFDKLKSNGRTAEFDTGHEHYYVNNMKDDDRDLHPRYYHDMISGNYRTTEFSTALANEQFKTIADIIKARNDNVKYLIEKLNKFSDIIQLPVFDEGIAYLGFPMLILKPELITRKDFRNALEEKEIETRPMYGCLPLDMPSLIEFKDEYKDKLHNCKNVGRNTFYIGCHQFLTREDLDYIVDTISEILEPLK